MLVIANSFVLRQSPDSPFSHYQGTWDQLCELVTNNLHNSKQGYRDGVMLVPVPADNFVSGICQLQPGDTLFGKYEARQAGELPRKSLYLRGGVKTKAQYCEIVCYHSDVLAENGHSQGTDCWEIISINASPTGEPSPIPVGALIANHLELSGGTASKMTDQEFVAQLRISQAFWASRVLAI